MTSFPDAELMDTWIWFRSGINSDGAHNPVPARQLKQGDILNLNCFPMRWSGPCSWITHPTRICAIGGSMWRCTALVWHWFALEPAAAISPIS
jgi:hypothetical protein